MARTFAFNVPIDIDVRGGDKLYNLLRQYAAGNREVVDEIAAITGEKINLTIETIIDVDTGQVTKELKRSTDLADQFVKKSKEASKAQEGSLTNLRQSVNALKQQRDAVARYVIDTEKVKKNLFGQTTAVREQSQRWTELNNKVKEAESALRKAGRIDIGGFQVPGFRELLSLSNKATEIGAAISTIAAAFDALNQVVQIFVQRQQQISGIVLTLTSFGASNRATEDTLAQAKRTALEYGVSLAQIEKAYKRLTPTILASGGSFQDADEVIKSLAARTLSLGLNTEQTGRYYEAFAQVLGKGKLSGEELNQQFSELDGSLRSQVAQFAAAKYGITNFEQALNDGAIRSKIFTEFIIQVGKAARDQLQIPLDKVQQSLDKLKPQQIQELGRTFDTIAIDGFLKGLAGIGKEIGGIILAFKAMVASIATNMPGLGRLFTDVFNILGQVVGVVFKIILISFQNTLIAVNTVANAIYFVLDSIRKIPGVETALQLIAQGWSNIRAGVNLTVDAISKVNPETVKARIATQEYMNKVAELYRQYELGKITLETLKAKTKELTEAEAFTKRKQLAEEYRSILDQTRTAIQGIIDKKNEEITRIQVAYTARKTALEEEIRLIEAPYNARIAALNAEEAKINGLKAAIVAKYALERGEVTKLQVAAKEASLAQERDELRILRAKETTTSSEAIALNAQIKQKEASIAAGQLELKVSKDALGLDIQRDKISGERAKVEAQREAASAGTKKRLEDLKAEEAARLGPLKLQVTEYERVISEIDATIKRTDDLKTATKNVADEINSIGANVKRLEGMKVVITKIEEARAFGGPVKAGRTYQVNELGKEAFLSSTGRLSMINKPAYGKWRAPSSGVVIPASVTERLVQAQAIYSMSPTSQAPSLIRRTDFQSRDSQYSQLAASQSAMAVELGKLTQAVDKINRKEWVVDLNIAPGNTLLNRLKRN